MGRNVENVSLAAGEIVSVRDSRRLTITVLEGRVWMTAENDSRDAFPVAGQQLEAPAGKLTVIEALGDAQVRIVAQPRFVERLADVFLTGLAYGALRLLSRFRGLRLNLSRGVALAPESAACRNGGC